VKHRVENYFGWYGVLAILLAYLLLSFNVIASKSLSYQLLNLTGALGIIAEATSKKDTQPAVLNIVWAIIAIFAIIRIT
jgi:predicted membrane metal-binding protein